MCAGQDCIPQKHQSLHVGGPPSLSSSILPHGKLKEGMLKAILHNERDDRLSDILLCIRLSNYQLYGYAVF